MTTTAEREPSRGPDDPSVAHGAAGLLGRLNLDGHLDGPDVRVAQRLGELGGETDEAVLIAVALAVRAVRGGSICLDLRRAGEELPDACPEPGAWRDAVAASPLTTAGVLRLSGELLYLARYWDEEDQVVRDLHGRDEAPLPQVPETDVAAALDRVLGPDGPTDQREAVALACRRSTSVVTGGPGTGKTTTIARLLAVLLSLPGGDQLRIGLAAPTGKAAARLTQALREAADRDVAPPGATRDRIRALEAQTLHRLLGWRPDSSTRFRHDRSNRLPYDVVVVDESSMVSLTMMARLLESVRPQARLVLVGDADQLASVEAGAVLGDIVAGWPAGPVRTLTTVHRFGRHIRNLAAAVRDGRCDDAVALLREAPDGAATEDGTLVWAEPGEQLDRLLRGHAVAVHDAARQGRIAEALAAAEEHRLLCAHRSGPAGVSRWNRHIEGLLMAATGTDWLPEWYAGRPFLVTANDRGLRLWNGDTGVLCRRPDGIAGGPPWVAAVGDSATAPRLLAPTQLAQVATAHALTVHRSQGSQFAEVTVVLPDPESRLLTRELLYTAVTRARRVVRIVGGEDALRAAVERRAGRATGLAQRLTAGGS